MKSSKKVGIILAVVAAAASEAIKPLNKQNADELKETILKFDPKNGQKVIDAIIAKNMSVKKTHTELMQTAAEVLPEGQTFIGKEPKPKKEKVAKLTEKDFTPEQVKEFEANIGKLATFKPNVRLGLGDSVEAVIVKFFFEKRSGRATYQLKSEAIDQPVHTLADNSTLKIGKKASDELLIKFKLMADPAKEKAASPATTKEEEAKK